MAKRWCFFKLETEKEISDWSSKSTAARQRYLETSYTRTKGKAIKKAIMTGSVNRSKDQFLYLLLDIEGWGDEALPGQNVVLSKREYTIASSLGILPTRIKKLGFSALPEGYRGGNSRPESRAIIPGVYEEVGVLRPSVRKGTYSAPIKASRADIEAAIRIIND